MTAMTPGSNIPLSAARVAVDVAAPVRLDVSGLLLTADGKVRSDDDFIFYNQPSGPGVTYRAGGGSAPDAIVVDTTAVPPGIEKIVVTASPDAAGQTFQGIEPTATVRNADDGSALATFTPPQLGAETALVVIEVYLRNGAWKARAVGQGYANGLAGIATDFGVSVEEPAGPGRASGSGDPRPGRAPAPGPGRRPRRPEDRPARSPGGARRGLREDQPGQGPGQPPEEPDRVPREGRRTAALAGQDGPGLGARVPRQGHRPGRVGDRLRPQPQPPGQLLLRQADHPQRGDQALRGQPHR
ncbi:hypothetical protein SBADM41S_01912 [Streptomyces badius]